MAHFIETSDGFVNLDRILRIQTGAAPDRRDILHLDNGEQLLCELYPASAADLVPFTPATPGTMATVITVDVVNLNEPPTTEDLLVEEEPIIAWRAVGDYLAPVFLHKMAINSTAFLRVGTKLHPLDAEAFEICETLDEAKQSVLREERRRQRDERQQRKAAWDR